VAKGNEQPAIFKSGGAKRLFTPGFKKGLLLKAALREMMKTDGFRRQNAHVRNEDLPAAKHNSGH